MNIRLFNKDYWLRRFGEQREVKGYLTSAYKDCVVSLNVHPLSSDQLQALPEGERRIKRLEAHGEYDLQVADQAKNIKGDLLLYHGEWYECISCQRWDHTILTHCNYQFVLVPAEDSKAYDLAKIPDGEPNTQGSEVRL